eukprot:352676_1
MAHLINDPKDYLILKSYWISHAMRHPENPDRISTGSINSISIHPNATKFATVGTDGKLKIWSMANIISKDVEISQSVSKLLAILMVENKKSDNTINCVQWSKNGEYLASGAADGLVTIWKLLVDDDNNTNKNNNKSNSIEHYDIVCQVRHAVSHNVRSVAFAPHKLISAGNDHGIVIWKMNKNTNNNNTETFVMIQRIEHAHNDFILGISIDPIEELLCSQGADGCVKIWKYDDICKEYKEEYRIENEFKKRSEFIRKNSNDDVSRLDVPQRPSFTPDGKYLVASFGVTEDNIFISPCYSREAFENEYCFVGHKKPTTVSKWNPRIYQNENESFYVIAVGGMDGKVSIWRSNKKKPIVVFANVGKESILDLAWSRTGDILLVCTHDGEVWSFVFGNNVFKGRQLPINEHVFYVDVQYNNALDDNIKQNIKNNITLTETFKFNQINKSYLLRGKKRFQHNSEEKQDEINHNIRTVGELKCDKDNDIQMETVSNGSATEFYIPPSNHFGAEERNANNNYDLLLKPIKLNAYPGKEPTHNNNNNDKEEVKNYDLLLKPIKLNAYPGKEPTHNNNNNDKEEVKNYDLLLK